MRQEVNQSGVEWSGPGLELVLSAPLAVLSKGVLGERTSKKDISWPINLSTKSSIAVFHNFSVSTFTTNIF
jgi:hypothetical protein